MTCSICPFLIKDTGNVSSGKSNKSPVPMEYMLSCIRLLCPYLLCLFNELFDRGEALGSFEESIICPTHKSGSFINVPGNFSGISLINTVCKVLLGIMITREQNWCGEFNVLDESQTGFRENIV